MSLPEKAPTIAELDAAWRKLCDRAPRAICDLTPGSIAEVALGNPEHAPDRYTAAEIRLARALIIVAAMALESEPTDA